jgi:hypothetical protein
MNRIRLQEAVLPEFQREYVWNEEQARQLLVSLYRDYPTGSLLFWDTTAPPAVKNQGMEQPQRGSQQVILDGQQRLTALYLLTQGEVPPYYTEAEIKHDPRSICFDLATGDFHHARGAEALPPSWVRVTDCFRGLADPTAIVDRIAKPGGGYAVAQLLESLYGNRQRLLNILERDYPVQLVPVTASLEDAIDVFDRVNSLGTKLTAAELALTHISGKWPEARPVMKAKLEALRTCGLTLDLDFMVRGIVGVVNGRARFDTIHHTPAPSLMEGWQRFEAALNYILTILDQHATIRSADDISSHEVLIPLIVHVARRGGNFEHEASMRRAIHWLYAASIWSRYGTETDQRLDHDLSIVRRNADPWTELEDAIVEQRGRIEVRGSDLEGRGLEHPLYQMARVVMIARGATDWSTGMSLSAAYSIHHHPLFPPSLLITEGAATPDDQLQRKSMEEIANRVFLVNNPPSPLIAQLGATEAKYPGILTSHCIPLNSDLWQPSQFSVFLRERRELIAEAINTHMQSFLANNPAARSWTLRDLIAAGESAGVEFKSTLRWDVKRNTTNTELEQEVAKTIAAFLNSEGGILVIGVEDNGNVYGIERDISTLSREHRNIDGFQVELQKLINERMGAEYSRYVRVHFDTIDDKTVCAMRVYRSPRPVMCSHKSGQGTPAFFVRTGNLTQSLTPSQINSYSSIHWAN